MWPLWMTALATVALVSATSVLASAAWRALAQLGLALEQLEEVKRDRHVQVLDEMGRRWEGTEMTEPSRWPSTTRRRASFACSSGRLVLARGTRSASAGPGAPAETRSFCYGCLTTSRMQR